MSVVAAAIVGSAVVGGVTSYASAERASDAAREGSQQAADVTLRNTELQLQEIRRQYDYQQQILLPQIQQQYNAQRAYTDLLGITGPQVGGPPQLPGPQPAPQVGAPGTAQPTAQPGARPAGVAPAPGAAPGAAVAPDPRIAELQAAIAEQEAIIERGGSGGMGTMRRMQEARNQANYLRGQLADIEQASGAGLPQMGAPGTSGVAGMRDPRTGAFLDPNLDPTRLAETETLSGQVRGTLLAGTSAEADPYRNYLEANRMAAATPEESIMARRAADVTLMGARGGENIAAGAAGTGVYGDVFQASPGYAFQVEEMQRQLDREQSAGGANIGGRQIMEAQRRAQGVAAGDYYNWAAGRTRDLERLGTAEAQDIMRRDQFAGTDIQRGDVAYQQYEAQRLQDVARQDQGYQDYLRRREGDVARMDAAAGQVDRLAAADLARQDQAYYNYLNAVQRQAGFGAGPAATAVSASQAQGGAVAGAYGTQGAGLANIYANQGVSQANINYAQGAGVSNAFQAGVGNWLTYRASQPGAGG